MGKRILIVDDAPIMRMILRNILRGSGYEIVGEAGNGNDAVKKYRELKPDVTTMDIIMPEKDGVTALGEILLYDANAKVIMITAVDQRDSLMKAIKAGAYDYITKPFEDARVLSALKKAFGDK